MTGRKGVFVPAFVGDVHRAQAFARWLDAQLNMSVDGSLYPIGRDQDAFRRCAVVQVKFLRYHHRIVDFLAFLRYHSSSLRGSFRQWNVNTGIFPP